MSLPTTMPNALPSALSGRDEDLARLMGRQAGVMPGLRPGGPAGRMSPAALAFQTQLSMAQALFSEPGNGRGGDPSAGYGVMGGGMDNALMNDALLMDALSTIARLTEPGPPSLEQGAVKAAGPSAAGGTARARAQTSGEAVIMGGLSAMFESGSAGVAAIGYDRVGGTSYGRYQIASRPGTMERFLDFLEKGHPQWASRLREAGPANTGSTRGAMPEAWRAIAEEDPNGFEKAQHDFIRAEHYAPARDMVAERTGLDLDEAPLAVREALWSTAVQHGPTGAADIFASAWDEVPQGRADEPGLFSDLLSRVYENRQGRFGSSTDRVQRSVRSRLGRELEMALNLLGTGAAGQTSSQPSSQPVDRLV